VCKKSQGFLAKKKADFVEITDAGSRRFTPEEVLRLTKRVSRIIATRGQTRVILDLEANTHSDEEILKLVMGPTGNLRAPTVLKGRTLLVGFNEGAYKEAFKPGDVP
jgi:arsenate reductase-like glutaredoxin family protein